MEKVLGADEGGMLRQHISSSLMPPPLPRAASDDSFDFQPSDNDSIKGLEDEGDASASGGHPSRSPEPEVQQPTSSPLRAHFESASSQVQQPTSSPEPTSSPDGMRSPVLPNSDEDVVDEEEEVDSPYSPSGGNFPSGGKRESCFSMRGAGNAGSALDFIDEVSDGISSYLGYLEERQRGVVYDRHEAAENTRWKACLRQIHLASMASAMAETPPPNPDPQPLGASFACPPPRDVQFEDPQILADGKPRLSFSSCFESGNLALAKSETPIMYTLLLDFDVNTSGYTQWFYFGVRGGYQGMKVTFRISNMSKADSMFSKKGGMKPAVWSEKTGRGWERGCCDVDYYANEHKRSGKSDGEHSSTYFTLEFSYVFEATDDTVFFAYHFPYTYTHLQELLDWLVVHPYSSRFVKRDFLCRTIGGLACEVMEVGEPLFADGTTKPIAIATARVHPGEANSSWMMQGMLLFLCSPTAEAIALREACLWIVVPMLNPDGVIQGNYRCGLAGTDLNRTFGKPHPKLHPTVWHLKERVKGRDAQVYIDLHGHSKKEGVFLYGGNFPNDDKRNAEVRLLPRLCALASSDFKYWQCVFSVQESKMSTARLVAFFGLNIAQSYTVEASFASAGIPEQVQEDVQASQPTMAQQSPASPSSPKTPRERLLHNGNPRIRRQYNSNDYTQGGRQTRHRSAQGPSRQISGHSGHSGQQARDDLSDSDDGHGNLSNSDSDDPADYDRLSEAPSPKVSNRSGYRRNNSSVNTPTMHAVAAIPLPPVQTPDFSPSRLELVGPTICRALFCNWQLTKGLRRQKYESGYVTACKIFEGTEHVGWNHLYYERLTNALAREMYSRLLTKREDVNPALFAAARLAGLGDADNGSDSEPEADEKTAEELGTIHKRLLAKLTKRKDKVKAEPKDETQYRTVIAFGKILKIPIVKGKMVAEIAPEIAGARRESTAVSSMETPGRRSSAGGGKRATILPSVAEKGSRPLSAPSRAMMQPKENTPEPSPVASLEEMPDVQKSEKSSRAIDLQERRRSQLGAKRMSVGTGFRVGSDNFHSPYTAPAVKNVSDPWEGCSPPMSPRLGTESNKADKLVPLVPRPAAPEGVESATDVEVAVDDAGRTGPSPPRSVAAATPTPPPSQKDASRGGTKSPCPSGIGGQGNDVASARPRIKQKIPVQGRYNSGDYNSSDVRTFVQVKSIKAQKGSASQQAAQYLKELRHAQASPVPPQVPVIGLPPTVGPESKRARAATTLHRIPLQRLSPESSGSQAKASSARAQTASPTIVSTQNSRTPGRSQTARSAPEHPETDLRNKNRGIEKDGATNSRASAEKERVKGGPAEKEPASRSVAEKTQLDPMPVSRGRGEHTAAIAQAVLAAITRPRTSHVGKNSGRASPGATEGADKKNAEVTSSIVPCVGACENDAWRGAPISGGTDTEAIGAGLSGATCPAPQKNCGAAWSSNAASNVTIAFSSERGASPTPQSSWTSSRSTPEPGKPLALQTPVPGWSLVTQQAEASTEPDVIRPTEIVPLSSILATSSLRPRSPAWLEPRTSRTPTTADPGELAGPSPACRPEIEHEAPKTSPLSLQARLRSQQEGVGAGAVETRASSSHGRRGGERMTATLSDGASHGRRGCERMTATLSDGQRPPQSGRQASGTPPLSTQAQRKGSKGARKTDSGPGRPQVPASTPRRL